MYKAARCKECSFSASRCFIYSATRLSLLIMFTTSLLKRISELWDVVLEHVMEHICQRCHRCSLEQVKFVAKLVHDIIKHAWLRALSAVRALRIVACGWLRVIRRLLITP